MTNPNQQRHEKSYEAQVLSAIHQLLNDSLSNGGPESLQKPVPNNTLKAISHSLVRIAEALERIADKKGAP